MTLNDYLLGENLKTIIKWGLFREEKAEVQQHGGLQTCKDCLWEKD